VVKTRSKTTGDSHEQMVRRPYGDGSRLDRNWNTQRCSRPLPLPQPIAVYDGHVTNAHVNNAARITNAVAVINVITVSVAKTVRRKRHRVETG
jgi:hypothetical protein